MNIKTRQLLLLFSIILCMNSVSAQSNSTEDGRMWAIASLKYKINDKWSSSLNNVMRIKDDISVYRDFFIEPALAYQFSPNIGVKASYRWTLIPNEGQDWQWIFLDLNLKQPLGDSPVFLTSRTRFHWGFNIDEFEDADFMREHLAVRAKLGKFSPFIAVASFFRLNDFNEIQVMRYEAGTSWKFAPQWILTAYYRRQDNVFDLPFRFRARLNVAVIGLSYSIPHKR